MAPNNKATVDNSTTIRAASRKKQRSQPSSRSSASPFGSSAGGSLASSLSSLFSPQPHGKDAALALLLASSSKPPVKLGQGSGLAAFGSFPNLQLSAPSSKSAPLLSLDAKQKDKRKDAATTPATKTEAASVKPAAWSCKGSVNAPAATDRQQKSTGSETRPSSAAASSSKPVVPNVPAGRRPVFRPVLASSTAVTWPEMPVAGSKTVLHTLLETLARPVVQEALYRDLGRRTRTRLSEVKRAKDVNAMETDDDSQTATSLAPPQLLAGINSITRAIEADIATEVELLRAAESTHVKKKGKAVVKPPSIKLVFVCRHDVVNPSLISHLPMLVTARNAVLHATSHENADAQASLLVALPSGSEPLLAKALNLNRATLVALTTAFDPTLLAHIIATIKRETGTICLLRAGWLETAMRAAKQSHATLGPISMPQQPTAIKLLRTTQPNDLNACKAQKKTKRKERSARWKKRKMQMQQRIQSLRAELKYEREKQRQQKKVDKLRSNM